MTGSNGILRGERVSRYEREFSGDENRKLG